MIYELHTYVSTEERVEALHRRFADRTLAIFERVGIDIVAFFVDRDEPTRILYLARFADEEARASAWKAFQEDPEWREVKEASEVDGPLITDKSAVVLEPTAYSPVL